MSVNKIILKLCDMYCDVYDVQRMIIAKNASSLLSVNYFFR